MEKHESGSSLVGSIFKADAAEALELNPKATPKQQKYGQRTIERFTGERELWGARVNQMMRQLRKLVPDGAIRCTAHLLLPAEIEYF